MKWSVLIAQVVRWPADISMYLLSYFGICHRKGQSARQGENNKSWEYSPIQWILLLMFLSFQKKKGLVLPDSIPSWPRSFRPQQIERFSTVMPQEWPKFPTLICLNLMYWGGLLCPYWFLPQHSTYPLSRKPHVLPDPQETWTQTIWIGSVKKRHS